MNSLPTILVVEDNDDDVFFMKRALKSTATRAEVRFLCDGKFALQYLRGEGEFADRAKHPLPALMFLDLKMPFVSGLELVAAIRGDPVLKKMRVIVLTSSNEQRDRNNAAALGVEGYWVKPVRPGTLAPILASISMGTAVVTSH